MQELSSKVPLQPSYRVLQNFDSKVGETIAIFVAPRVTPRVNGTFRAAFTHLGIELLKEILLRN